MTKKMSKTKEKSVTPVAQSINSRLERLELILSMTLKRIRPGSKDSTMAEQAIRLKKEISKFRGNKQ